MAIEDSQCLAKALDFEIDDSIQLHDQFNSVIKEFEEIRLFIIKILNCIPYNFAHFN